MRNILQSLKIITLAIFLSLGLSYVYAWTAPTAQPPDGNTAAPLNTSLTSQYKGGALGVEGLIHGYTDAYFDGKVGIGTLDPKVALHVMNNIFIENDVDHPGGPTLALIGTNDDWIINNNLNNNASLNIGSQPHSTGVTTGRFTISTTGDVGIGTTIPLAKLDVNGTVKATGIEMPTGAGAGKVLTSDASGVGGWQINAVSASVPSGTLCGAAYATYSIGQGGPGGPAQFPFYNCQLIYTGTQPGSFSPILKSGESYGCPPGYTSRFTSHSSFYDITNPGTLVTEFYSCVKD